MPLYEYQCQQCQRRVEKIQKFSDAPLTTCPHCGGALERTLTAPAIQFKGSGWYKDLYSSAKPAAAATGDGSAGSGDASKPTGSSAESGGPGNAGSDSGGSGSSGSGSGGLGSGTAPAPSAPATPATASPAKSNG